MLFSILQTVPFIGLCYSFLRDLFAVLPALFDRRYLRWNRMISAHGLDPMSAFRLINKNDLPIAGLQWPHQVANRLTDEVLQNHASLLNVRKDWIDGSDDRIYETIFLDSSFPPLVHELIEWSKKGSQPEMLVFRSGRLEIQENSCQSGALVLRTEVGKLGNRSVHSYKPIFSLQQWNNDKQSYLGMRAIWAAWRMGFSIKGYRATENECRLIAEGKELPASVIRNKSCVWHPDDYVVRPSVHEKGHWIDHISNAHKQQFHQLLDTANFQRHTHD